MVDTPVLLDLDLMSSGDQWSPVLDRADAALAAVDARVLALIQSLAALDSQITGNATADDRLAASIEIANSQVTIFETNITNLSVGIQANTVAINDLSIANERGAGAAGAHSGALAGAGSSAGIAALAFGALGIAAEVTGVKFEAAMSKVEGFAGVSHTQLEQMKTDVLAMAEATGESPTKLAEGLYYVVSAGFQGADAMRILRETTELAKAALIDTAPVADVVTSAMKSYGYGVDQLTHVTDVLTATTVAGKLQFSDLANELGRVLPISAALGIPLEQVGAAVATMTTKMGGPNSTAEAVTAYRAALLELEHPHKQTVDELHLLGLSVDDVRKEIADKGYLETLSHLMTLTNGNVDALGSLFPNVRAFSGALADTGQSANDYAAALDRTTNSSGAAANAVAAHANTTLAHWERLKSTVLVDLIQLGGAVNNFVDPAVVALGDFFALLSAPKEQFNDTMTAPFRAVLDFLGDEFVPGASRALSTVADAAGVGWDAAVSTVKGGINDVIGVIDDFIGEMNQLSIHIPGALGVPGFDWSGPGIPPIPRLEQGIGAFPGGLAVVGEAGPELVSLPPGAAVFSHGNSAAMLMAAGVAGIPGFQDGTEPQPPGPDGTPADWEAYFAAINGRPAAATGPPAPATPSNYVPGLGTVAASHKPVAGAKPSTAQEVVTAITKFSNDNGIPPQVLLAMALGESGLDSTNVGDGGQSFGPLQIYQPGVAGGPHPDITAAQAQDINVDLSIMGPSYIAAWKKWGPTYGKGDAAAQEKWMKDFWADANGAQRYPSAKQPLSVEAINVRPMIDQAASIVKAQSGGATADIGGANQTLAGSAGGSAQGITATPDDGGIPGLAGGPPLTAGGLTPPDASAMQGGAVGAGPASVDSGGPSPYPDDNAPSFGTSGVSNPAPSNAGNQANLPPGTPVPASGTGYITVPLPSGGTAVVAAADATNPNVQNVTPVPRYQPQLPPEPPAATPNPAPRPNAGLVTPGSGAGAGRNATLVQAQIDAALHPDAFDSYHAAEIVTALITAGDTDAARQYLATLPAAEYDKVLSLSHQMLTDAAKRSGGDATALESALDTAGVAAAPSAAKNVTPKPKTSDTTVADKLIDAIVNPNAPASRVTNLAEQVAHAIESGDLDAATKLLASSNKTDYASLLSEVRQILKADADKAGTDAKSLQGEQDALTSAATTAAPTAAGHEPPKTPAEEQKARDEQQKKDDASKAVDLKRAQDSTGIQFQTAGAAGSDSRTVTDSAGQSVALAGEALNAAMQEMSQVAADIWWGTYFEKQAGLLTDKLTIVNHVYSVIDGRIVGERVDYHGGRAQEFADRGMPTGGKR